MVEGRQVATVVIGDVVGSRRAVDRRALHETLTSALAYVDRSHGAGLRLTAGDEYQGTFPDLGSALRATLALRLALLPETDVRHGVGLGPVEEFDEAAGIGDGPGWWVARAAIESVKEAEGRSATRSVRTAFRLAEGTPGPDPRAVNAALLGRDELVGRLSPRGLSVLRGLLADRTQREIAADLGLSTSAVSQRVRNDGVGVLLAMEDLLRGVR